MICRFWVVLIFVFSLAFPQEKKETLLIVPSSWDFGIIKHNSEVTLAIVINNTGKRPVKLFTLPQTCGCTIIKPQPKTVPPGGQAKLSVSFRPGNRTGYLRREIRLGTDLPGNPKIIVPVTARVLRDAILSEKAVNFGVLRRDQKKKVILWMACRWHREFILQAVNIDVDGFVVEFHETTISEFYPGDQRGYRIAISAGENIDFGRKEGFITFFTDIPGHEEIKLPLFAYVTGDIKPVPAYLAFGLVRPGIPCEKKVTVFHYNAKEFHITRVESTLPFISSRIKTIILDQRYCIFVRLKPSRQTKEGEFRGILRIYTDLPAQPMLEIHLQGILQSRTKRGNYREIPPEDIFSKKTANFGTFKRGREKSLTLWMASDRYPRFKLQTAKASLEGFEVGFREVMLGSFSERRGYRIDIIAKKDISFGRKDGLITFVTDIPKHEKIKLPFSACVIGAIKAVPENIFFGVVKPGMAYRRTVVLRRSEKFQITRIESTIPFVSTKIKTLAPTKRYIVVNLKCPHQAKIGEFEGFLHIHTDQPSQPSIEIHLRGFIGKFP